MGRDEFCDEGSAEGPFWEDDFVDLVYGNPTEAAKEVIRGFLDDDKAVKLAKAYVAAVALGSPLQHDIRDDLVR
ncbi:hypothetical protein ACFLZN_02455, partial [Nanoarchaeota archaeon]